MNPCELAYSVTTVAVTLAQSLNDDDLALWASIFVQLGDTLASIAVQRDRCKPVVDQ